MEPSGKSYNNKSANALNIQCEGITQPFQFSLNGNAFTKNGGVFENLEDGYYNISITNAYDTIMIENVKVGNPTTEIANNSLDEINIYPNPSTGVFYLS